MKIIKHIFSFLILSCFASFVFFSVTEQVFANSSLWDMQDENIKNGISEPFADGAEAPTDVRLVVINVIKIFLSFLGIIFLTLIIWAGFKWMMSRGNQDEVGTAKAQIITAIIGFVIIVCSLVIVKFVNDSIRKDLFNNPW